MAEYNLLESFPKCERNFTKGWRTEKNRKIARRFDKDFFDGDRINGYGGFYYDGRWQNVADKIIKRYSLDTIVNASVLDVGCAKGYLVIDLINKGIDAQGLDISNYALDKTLGCRNKLIYGHADRLPYIDKSFDCVVSINTLHNLEPLNLIKAVHEMQRVCKNDENLFIQVDAYNNKKEKKTLENFNLTGKTYMSVKEWKEFFKAMGYKGDYYWTIFRDIETKIYIEKCMEKL